MIMGADTPTGLTTGRSLSDMPVKLIGLYDRANSVTLSSRIWWKTIDVSGSISDQFDNIINIKKNIESDTKPVLLFSSDEQVIGYWEHNKELERHFIVPVAQYDCSHFLMNKTLFHEWAVDNQILVPPAIVINNNEDLGAVKNFNYFPCVLKPTVRKTEWDFAFPNKKLIKFESFYEFEYFTAGRNIFDYSNSYILQKWIDGGDEDVYFVLYAHDLAGSLLGKLGGQKHLQWPTGDGSTSICEICNDKDLMEAASRVFQRLEVIGLNSVEFKKDRTDGKFYVTEPTVGRNDYQSGLSMLHEPNLTRILVESLFELNGENILSATDDRKGLWVDDKVLLQHIKNLDVDVFKIFVRLLFKNRFNIKFLLFSFRDLGPIKEFLRSKIRKRGGR